MMIACTTYARSGWSAGAPRPRPGVLHACCGPSTSPNQAAGSPKERAVPRGAPRDPDLGRLCLSSRDAAAGLGVFAARQVILC
jgi:hypothetical protein